MSFFKLLNFDNIQVGTNANDQESILKEIARLSKNNKTLKNLTEDEIYTALKEREKICSTGFGNYIAIPHCSFNTLNDFVVGVVVAPQGIEFKAIDKQKTKVFFYIIGPTSMRNKHIKILSSISRLAKSKENISKIIASKNKEELIDCLYNAFEDGILDNVHQEKCLLQVFIQNEDYFDDILQILASSVEGAVSVIETNNAGYYLHTLPLFAGFWSDKQKTFMKIIYSVMDKSLMNDVIRRIHMIGKTKELEAGILITAQNLIYSAGSIDF